ncbi:MAG: hypothetical protein AB7O55_19885 [Lautropia sp.]
MALHEESMADRALGRWMNHDLAEYHIPCHADIGRIEVISIDEPDAAVTPLGIKGVEPVTAFAGACPGEPSATP